MTCDDLRIGGTLSGSGITGGVSVNSTALAVDDWSGLFGHSGLSFTPFGVTGRPGSIVSGDGLGKHRLPVLNMIITKWGAAGVGSLTQPTPDRQLKTNTDVLLGRLARPAGNYLEVDMPDGTQRFIHARALDPAQISQRIRRRMGIPLFAEWPYWWAGATQSTQVINGADTLINAGNVSIYDAMLVFSGNGTFTHSGLGWTLTIAGGVSAVTVNLGQRTVTQGGLPVPGLLTRNNRDWGWFTAGSNSVTSTVSVTVTWRNQWQ
jgi:hypothetical protein